MMTPPIASFRRRGMRRAEVGELPDETLYHSGAQWSCLYARMNSHTPEERERHGQLAGLRATLDTRRDFVA